MTTLLAALTLTVTVLFGNGTTTRPVRCVVDTGAMHTILRGDQAAAIRDVIPPYAQPVTVNGIGGARNGEFRLMPTLKVEGSDLPLWRDAWIIVLHGDATTSPYPCLLGANVLFRQPFAVTNDGLRAFPH